MEKFAMGWKDPETSFWQMFMITPFWMHKEAEKQAKKESSDEESSTSGSEDKEHFQRSRDDKNGKSDRKCFRCGDSNHLIEECLKPSRDKNQRAFVEGSWSIAVRKMMKRLKTKRVSWLKHLARYTLNPLTLVMKTLQ
nr:retrotransposon protein, putative, unclassified [Tanacetum cinerariifolium]